MDAVAQFFNLAINMIMAPYDPNAMPFAVKPPVNYCASNIIKFGENELKFSPTPRGLCPNCCSINPNIVRFIYYSRSKRNGAQIWPIAPGSANKTGLRSDLPTEIFVHGFSEPSPAQSGQTFIDAYLSRPEDYNIVLVDWSELATFPWYKPAVQNVKYAAEMLKNFLEVFNDSGEIPIGRVHVVGFSLGSHIAGFAGKRLRSGMRIPRITALDPAFPEFSLDDERRRLSRKDADYIDVIHTDAGILGLPFPVGHADFYPNGGRALQPGCQPSYLLRLSLVEQILACSHVRAWRLYAESVRNPEAFPATRCKSFRGVTKKCQFTRDAMMGYPNNRSVTGQFYLTTSYKSPFSELTTLRGQITTVDASTQT